MKNKSFIVIIFGPTGVGKSDCAELLAARINGEIINGDMGQCYTPLSIGTAKPDWRNNPIKHHLYDIIDEPCNLTAFQYRELIIETINNVWAAGKVPIIVGGSGFYLTSLFFPPQTSPEIAQVAQPKLSADLWKELSLVDPERAAQINPHDIYRLQRALAIFHSSGVKPSTLAPIYKPLANFMLVCVTRSRDELYARINARVTSMIDAGWIREVEKLRGTGWESFLHKKKLIGYDRILSYLAGTQTPEAKKELIAAIEQQTRNYAKRQMTFWRGLERRLTGHMLSNSVSSLNVINLTLTSIDLYIEQLSLTIKTALNNGQSK